MTKRIQSNSDNFTNEEWEQVKAARAAARAADKAVNVPKDTRDPVEIWLEDRNRKKTVRDLGKGVTSDLRQTVKRKGGDDRVMGGVHNAIYDQMGGSPEPKGKRDKWSNRNIMRNAVNEHMAKNEINHRCKDGRVPQNPADQRHLNDGIVDAARQGARNGESLQNDSETGISTGGWFGWLFGSEAEKEPDPIQYEIPLDTKDPNHEWTAGDLARKFFLGGRDGIK